MKVLITGGAGFIGSNFIFHMRRAHPDYQLLCVDKLTYAGNLETLAPVMEDPKFKFVRADIANRKAIYEIFETERPDVVVNFAAESHVDRSIENPSVFLETNVMGTQVLLDACRTYGVQRYHQVSTDEVYGDLPLDRPDLFFTEQTPCTPLRPIPHPRPQQTCCATPISAPTACQSPFPAALIIMVPINSRKS